MVCIQYITNSQLPNGVAAYSFIQCRLVRTLLGQGRASNQLDSIYKLGLVYPATSFRPPLYTSLRATCYQIVTIHDRALLLTDFDPKILNVAFQELSFFLAEALVTSNLALFYKIVPKFKSSNSFSHSFINLSGSFSSFILLSLIYSYLALYKPFLLFTNNFNFCSPD